MRKILGIITIITIVLSCSKDQLVLPVGGDTTMLSPEDARCKFAKVLSSAVSDNEDLRMFIHNEARKEFDMDFDVFYPFVKDMTVSKDMTFREILLQYISEEELNCIEESEPKLNILVPDWKWLGCFSIKDWDPECEIPAVGYESLSIEKTIFADGSEVGKITSAQIPAFPIIIVKSNERMIYNKTKSGDLQFDFANEAFNPACYPKTKVEHEYYDIIVDGEPDVSNFMPASSLNSFVTNAYDEFLGNEYAAHRDYIYFGMTEDNTVGQLNTHINECIHKIKFSNSYSSMDGIRENGDFVDKSFTYEYKENDNWQTAEQLRNIFYSEGNIELHFHITFVNQSGIATTIPKVVTADFEDMFALKHVSLDFRHRTWFCRDWYVYSINHSFIYPRWFEVNLRIPNWDITTQSSSVFIMVEEYDDGTSYTYESSVEATYMKNFSLNADASGSVGGSSNSGNNSSLTGQFKIGLGYGSSTTEKESSTCRIQRTDTSDSFGAAYLNYMDPVIIGETTKGGIEGYNIKLYETGMIDMIILPIYE